MTSLKYSPLKTAMNLSQMRNLKWSILKGPLLYSKRQHKSRCMRKIFLGKRHFFSFPAFLWLKDLYIMKCKMSLLPISEKFLCMFSTFYYFKGNGDFKVKTKLLDLCMQYALTLLVAIVTAITITSILSSKSFIKTLLNIN